MNDLYCLTYVMLQKGHFRRTLSIRLKPFQGNFSPPFRRDLHLQVKVLACGFLDVFGLVRLLIWRHSHGASFSVSERFRIRVIKVSKAVSRIVQRLSRADASHFSVSFSGRKWHLCTHRQLPTSACSTDSALPEIKMKSGVRLVSSTCFRVWARVWCKVWSGGVQAATFEIIAWRVDHSSRHGRNSRGGRTLVYAPRSPL